VQGPEATDPAAPAMRNDARTGTRPP